MRELVDWTEERLSALREMWSAGYSSGQIAKSLGVSRSAVAGVVHRGGMKRGNGHYAKFTLRAMSYDRDAILDRYAAGQTAKAIADALGIRSHRSVQDVVAAARHRGDPRAAMRPKAPPKPKPTLRRPAVVVPEVVEPPAADYHGPLGTAAVLAIRDSQCKWPIGSIQAPEFHFCCEPVWSHAGRGPSMYCAYHHRIAYTPAQPARKEAA